MATPAFAKQAHIRFITTLSDKLQGSYEGAVTEHLKMSGIYWSLTALSLLAPSDHVDEAMTLTTRAARRSNEPPSIVDFVFSCFDAKSGGFGGNVQQNGHLLYTLSALQILAVADRLFDERLPREAVIAFVVGLQNANGSFCGDAHGEIDTRFSYCALASLALLRALDRVKVEQACRYIVTTRNFDGGFGAVPGGESHAGQVFCCVGALAIGQHLHLLADADIGLLGWWLSERQVDSGGLNGRPEKQSDVCYSWWILSVMAILGKMEWINRGKLVRFILQCQDVDDGGIADRPDDMADVFHTFFGIAGLSLLGYLHQDEADEAMYCERKIDPVYALPTDVVRRLGLSAQIVLTSVNDVDERLSNYNFHICR